MINTFWSYFSKISIGITLLFFGLNANATHNNYFTLNVPDAEIVGQFHGNPQDADLVLYMAGNQFVVLDLLISEFKHQHPKYKNIFYVTIPPGKLLQWILKGGIEIKAASSLESEGFQLTVLPDVYTTVNKGHMDTLNAAGLITQSQTYAHNRLTFMLRSDDPFAGQILSPVDLYNFLSDPIVTISEPDIITQGIERHIWQMYTDLTKTVFPDNPAVQAMNPRMFNPDLLVNDPPESLRKIIYLDKVSSGATTLTSIHHLETPAALRANTARAGSVWITEINFQNERLLRPDVTSLEIGGVGPDGKLLNRSEKVNYLAAMVGPKGKPKNKHAAQAWIDFLISPIAQGIIQTIGFIPATDDELSTPFVYPQAHGDENDDDDDDDDDD